MRKKRILIFAALAFIFLIKVPVYATTIPTSTLHLFHNEIVGTFAFEHLSYDYLLLKTKVEKRHFVHALRKEGECSPKEMMKICGDKYLQDNFQVEVNGEPIVLHQEEIIIEKDFVLLTYTIRLQGPKIEEIKVKSDYMFAYNDHSIVKVIFDLGEKRRSFNIKNERRTIIAKF